MKISKATISDIPELLVLVQGSYRGESAKKGWTHEADLIEGTRTRDQDLASCISGEGTDILICRLDENDLENGQNQNNDNNKSHRGKLIGCVQVEVKKMTSETSSDSNKSPELECYFGMLSVTPEEQGQGIGKKLMWEVESWAKDHGCSRLSLVVLTQRPELIAWYERHGFRATGVKVPFDFDEYIGIPKQKLDMFKMERMIV